MRGVTACQVSHCRPIPLVIKANCPVLRLIMEEPKARDEADASSSCDTLLKDILGGVAVAVLGGAIPISAISSAYR